MTSHRSFQLAGSRPTAHATGGHARRRRYLALLPLIASVLLVLGGGSTASALVEPRRSRTSAPSAARPASRSRINDSGQVVGSSATAGDLRSPALRRGHERAAWSTSARSAGEQQGRWRL